MSFSAKSYSLGSSGTLVEMHIPPPSSSGPSCSAEPATPIIILDQSGSMGQWATRFPPILSEALTNAGFLGDQRAEFVTFATGCAHSTTTVRGLHRKGAESRGNTNMAPAVERLRRLLAASDPAEEFQLVVVSDGCVNDLFRVLAAADALRAECAAAGRTIDASLIRLLTSRHGAPDTRAVSCLGQLAATRVDVLDLYGMDGCDERVRTNMVREIRKTLRGCNKHRIEFSQPVSTSLTGRGARASSLTFNEGPNYLMIPHHVDVSNLQVEYNGQTFDVEKHSGTFGEEDIRGFLKFVEGKMRMLAVVETATARETLTEMSDWLSGVEQALSSMAADNEEEKKEADAADYTLASRKKAVVAKVLKSQKGLVNSLKRLANADAVANLNSQQKADFLRGVSNNKSGRGLAKRAARSTADMTPDELVADGVRNLAAARIPMHEEDAAIKSFYSFASAPECLELASELTQLDGASAVDVLQYGRQH